MESKHEIDEWINNNYDNFKSIILTYFNNLDEVTNIYEKLIKMKVETVRRLIRDNEFHYYLVRVVRNHLYIQKPEYLDYPDYERFEYTEDEDLNDYRQDEIDLVRQFIYDNYQLVKFMRGTVSDEDLIELIYYFNENEINDLSDYIEKYKMHFNYYEIELLKLKCKMSYRQIQNETTITYATANILVNKCVKRMNKIILQNIWEQQ